MEIKVRPLHFKSKICDDKRSWDAFVASSPQGNIFCTTQFLDAQGEDYELLFVEKNNDPQMGAVVIKKEGQPVTTPFMYQGIMFSNSIMGLPNHTRLKRMLEATDFLLNAMEQCYGRIAFNLHYKVEDLRSFQWFNYHQPEKGRFRIELRYTGLLDLMQHKDFGRYLSTIRSVRRYEYRQALDEGLMVEESTDISALDKLHRMTFERQGIKRSEGEERLAQTISREAISKGFGRLLLCRDGKGYIAAASVFLFDARCGYYILGANDPNYRNAGSGTYLLLEQIKRCKEQGFKVVDFVGINSPNRGDFKTSFNAFPMPHFLVSWEKP